MQKTFFKREGLKQFFLLLMPIFFLASLPTLSNWLKNRNQVNATDLILPLIIQLINSLLIAGFFFRLFKQDKLSAYLGAFLAACWLSQGFDNRYNQLAPFLKAVLPMGSLQSGVELAASLLLLGIALLSAKWLAIRLALYLKPKPWQTKEAARGLAITVTVIFVLQSSSVASKILKEWPQFNYRPAALATKPVKPKFKPDIYYIVLDRYTNQDVLTNSLGFTNEEFSQFLKDQNFYLNPSAYSSYPYTTMSIASTLKASYHGDLVQKFSQSKYQVFEPYHNSILYSPVISEFKKLGYSYYQLGNWYETSNRAPLADQIYQPEGLLTIFGKTMALSNFSKTKLLQSPYGKLIQCGFSIGNFNVLTYAQQSEIEGTESKLGILQELAQKPAGGRFIFAHLLSPHDPYFFNPDGSHSNMTSNDNNGKPVQQKYLDQVKYLNQKIERIVTLIKEQSKNEAIIILQTDEGPYPGVLLDEDFDGASVGEKLDKGNMLDWSDASLKMKYGVLAAYYIPQANLTALQTAADSVNVFRLVFNTYFEQNLPYFPRCHYGFSKGRENPFVYTDLTSRITGVKTNRCPANGNL